MCITHRKDTMELSTTILVLQMPLSKALTKAGQQFMEYSCSLLYSATSQLKVKQKKDLNIGK